MNKPHRNTIFVVEADILSHEHHVADQHILRVLAPEIATHARAGSFAHITVDPQRPLRRPISIMRVDKHRGEVEFLYKVFGKGTALLARRTVGETLNILGPIGKPFTLHMERPRPLLIGGGVGIPPMIFLATETLMVRGAYQPFVIMGSEVPFPFKPQPSRIMVPGMAAEVIAAMPLLEDWGIPSRLASLQAYAGCHAGYVTDVARNWLDALSGEQRKEVEVFACGPHPMLEAVAGLAREYQLPCQLSMEEFMACGVGGCAGCAIEVQTAQGPAMQRVCVDGPVFDARAVFPA
ncbi:MAG: dihydroorotate dehydrogenase electron transfer subunit [Thiohalomonadaceae bacterium]